MRTLLALAIVLALIPMGAAQDHGHGSKGMAMVLHDGPDSGRAVVGGVTHLGFALLDADGRLAPHQDAEIVVTQGEDVLFSSASAHEYDGLFGIDLVFTRPGPYQVVAKSGDMMLGLFEGEAVMPANASAATIGFVSAAAGLSPNVVVGFLTIEDEGGAILPHTDAILEFRRAGEERLVARVHTHIHNEPIAFAQAFDLPGEYVMRVTAYLAYPTGRGADVPSVVAEFLTAGAAGIPSVPLPGAAASPIAPGGAVATGGGHTLQGMYDPQPLVGVGNPFRLSALVTEDANKTPKAHVDFEFELRGPRGVVFSSTSLHEYDGVFEYTYAADAPGAYDATLTAIVGDARLTIPYHVQVAPPVVPLDAGPKTVSIDGLDALVTGVPGELVFTIAGPSGPLTHSEVDVTVSRPGEAALYQFKLHGHEGVSSALLLFPAEGEWLVIVDPTPLEPQPSPVFGPAGPRAPIVFTATVAPGLAVPGGEDIAAADAGALASVPGPALGLALAALAAVALLRRR